MLDILFVIRFYIISHVIDSIILPRLGATLTVLRDRRVEGNDGEEERRALEILVRKVPDDQQVSEVCMQKS